MDIGERILDIIIDKMQSMYNFKISMIQIKDDMYPSESNAMVSHEVINNKKEVTIYNLYLCKYNYLYINEIMLDLDKRHNKELFESLNIGYNKYGLANYVFTILHELGHIYDFYCNRNHIVKFYNIMTILDSSINLLQSFSINEKESQSYYIDRREEVIADRFAYQHLPMILNLLKENGIDLYKTY